MEWWRGKRTYLVAGAMAVVTFLKAAGIIDTATAETLFMVLGPAGLATFRAAVK